ncbi:glycerol acyltransferase [Burkholderia sp. WAC0059]|uniref:MFS transporter n=1 Tax=Burkholderia sp. WAC0059 TaxID=2066022 RepID=UPI000C7F650E|nr:MFS transporter [Burkholderia sp. WAC0059]PLZ00359.1 glycerol acyltransferase [Burkholderia sp. WAC0059]
MSDRPIQVSRRRPDAAPGHASQFRLMRERRFAPFFWTQFFGAMNDNVFKIGFTSLVTYQAARFSGVDPKTAAFLISAIFIVPFVLFSATSGQIADKYDKAMLMRGVKTFEIAVMLVGAAGFWLHSAPLLYACTFLMGVHSTVFGPVKYAYLPQQLGTAELVGGNGLVEMGTFVAILVGTIAGGVAAGLGGDAGGSGNGGIAGVEMLGGLCLAIALAGRLVSHFVPACPPVQSGLRINWNPFGETWRNLKLAHRDRMVFLGLIGISWLWFVGATFLASFFNFAKDVLSADPDVVTVLLAMFSLGIGLGSLLCERLSRRRLEIGLVPLGSLGMSAFAIDLYFASHALPRAAHLLTVAAFLRQPAHWRVLADLFLLAMFGGFYSVPLYALIQSRSEPGHRARIIAANNILNSLFMIVSSLMAMALTAAGVGIPGLFLVTALLNVALAGGIYLIEPAFLLRFVLWGLGRTVHRARLEHDARIPARGPALLVCGGTDAAGALAMLVASPRPVRLVVASALLDASLTGWLLRRSRAIPAAAARAAGARDAIEPVAQALEQGELVCVFARPGDSGSFLPDVARILARAPAPVVPVTLSGQRGRVPAGRPPTGQGEAHAPRTGLTSRLTLTVGEPLEPGAATPERLKALLERSAGRRDAAPAR